MGSKITDWTSATRALFDDSKFLGLTHHVGNYSIFDQEYSAFLTSAKAVYGDSLSEGNPLASYTSLNLQKITEEPFEIERKRGSKVFFIQLPKSNNLDAVVLLTEKIDAGVPPFNVKNYESGSQCSCHEVIADNEDENFPKEYSFLLGQRDGVHCQFEDFKEGVLKDITQGAFVFSSNDTVRGMVVSSSKDDKPQVFLVESFASEFPRFKGLFKNVMKPSPANLDEELENASDSSEPAQSINPENIDYHELGKIFQETVIGANCISQIRDEVGDLYLQIEALKEIASDCCKELKSSKVSDDSKLLSIDNLKEELKRRVIPIGKKHKILKLQLERTTNQELINMLESHSITDSLNEFIGIKDELLELGSSATLRSSRPLVTDVEISIESLKESFSQLKEDIAYQYQHLKRSSDVLLDKHDAFPERSDMPHGSPDHIYLHPEITQSQLERANA